jgi:hypothetical protein
MGLPKLILRTVNKYLKGREKRCQSLVTVTYIKQKINCIQLFAFRSRSLFKKSFENFNELIRRYHKRGDK